MESEHKLFVLLVAIIALVFIGGMYLELRHTAQNTKQAAIQEERLHTNYVRQCAMGTEHNTAWCEMRWIELMHNPTIPVA